VLAATLLTACGKPPVEELSLSKGAVDAAVSEGADQYAADELKVVNDAMEAALAEIKVQDGKMFKDYEGAKAQLAKVQADAEALKTKVAQRKEELKNSAVAALGEAQTVVAEAMALLEVAPKGKGSLADIEAMKNDVAGLEVELQGVQPQIDSGDFIAAIEKAHAVQGKALSISDEVKAVQEKLAALKK